MYKNNVSRCLRYFFYNLNIYDIISEKRKGIKKMSIFEAGMLISFGAAWPLNIYKSIKTRSAVGKSVLFLIVVFIGYVCGIIHKILYSRDIVLSLYIINITMVFIDILLYFRNKKYDLQKTVKVGN